MKIQAKFRRYYYTSARRSNQSILKEISPGCSLEGMMLKLKLQYFGHLMQSWLLGKDSDGGRDWGQEEKGMTEDGMAGWHHWLDGRESEWTPGVGDGQGGLACCDSWCRKESDTTDWTELITHLLGYSLKILTILTLQRYRTTGILIHWPWECKLQNNFRYQFGNS